MEEVSTSNLCAKIAELIQTARNETIRAVNQTMVRSYFEIGRIIVEDEQEGATRAEYGKQTLEHLAKNLTENFGKGFSIVNLRQMRSFYLAYSIQQTTSAELQSPKFKLSWSHYLKLMRIADAQERAFYEIGSSQNNWTLRELQRQFDSALYQRLALSRDKDGVKRLSETGQIVEKPLDVLKDPYVLEFLCLPERSGYSENDLESEIIGNLEQFLLELGKGFAFVGRQVRFTFDERHFRVDLVFFNRLLKCFVLIDLKIGELTHQDIGQMQMYVNYYDRFVKLADENKTVGILLCRDKSNVIVEITLPENNEQLFASSYKTVLPEKAELIKLLKQSEI